jgi:hypothetical protein
VDSYGLRGPGPAAAAVDPTSGFRLVAQGQTDAEIAGELFTSASIHLDQSAARAAAAAAQTSPAWAAKGHSLVFSNLECLRRFLTDGIRVSRRPLIQQLKGVFEGFRSARTGRGPIS